ncbi:hypothetical protein CANMA_000609 [Candida margitis]|uniref:uncharacterized protein n=1 Tax=Candida margitis TaxID=1775924 RepID=UPI002226BE45|nr:uncharacterized protein CANMA_000609 [Candida margitis]KAI5970257.1 hypothetical protein CANMA_000609 [Candida margitis]
MSAYLYIALAQDERIRKRKNTESRNKMNGGDFFITASTLSTRSSRFAASSANSIKSDSSKSKLSRTSSRSTTSSGNTTSSTKSSNSSSTIKRKQSQPEGQEQQDILIRDGKKWEYDSKLNKYVALERTPYQTAKLGYLHCLSTLSSMVNHELNLQINQSVVKELSNLELLRFSYFDKFDYDGDKLNGEFNTASTLVSVKTEPHKSALSAIVSSTISSTVHDSNDETTITGGSDSIHNKCHSNMRSLLASDQFWNTCYQDLKFESMAEAKDDYDLLPSMNTSREFYVGFIDYVLVNLHILRPSLDEINDSREYNQLAKQYYVYLNDHNYALLHQLHCQFVGKVVNDKLIQTVIANFDAVKRTYQLDANLVAIWKQFLQFIGQFMKSLSQTSPSKIEQPNPTFSKKVTTPQPRPISQQSRQASVGSQSSSSIMSHTSKREGSVWTLDTVVSSIEEIESSSSGGSTRLLSLAKSQKNHETELKSRSQGYNDDGEGMKDDIKNTTKKKKSFFGKITWR